MEGLSSSAAAATEVSAASAVVVSVATAKVVAVASKSRGRGTEGKRRGGFGTYQQQEWFQRR